MAIKNDRNKVLRNLYRLIKKPGYFYSLILILKHDLFLIPEEVVKINWRERLMFQEINFLVGLMIKNRLDLSTYPTRKKIGLHINETYKLMDELHKSYMDDAMGKIFSKAKFDKKKNKIKGLPSSSIWKSGDMMIEPIFYGDSGAYDFQYWNMLGERYKLDQEYFKKNKIDLKVFVDISRFLKDLAEKKVRKQIKSSDHNAFLDNALDIFCFCKDDLIKNFKEEAVDQLIQFFSSEYGNVNNKLDIPGDSNILDIKPIIKLNKKVFFLPILFSLARSVYESPYYWMINSNYKEKSLKNRGQITTDIAQKMLSKTFGSRKIHRDVKIVKSKKETTTDIDLLCLFGNKAIVVQAKSKKLTQKARSGKTYNLKEDFYKGAQSAYDQALQSIKSLNKGDSKLVDSNGKNVFVSSEINEIYVLCLLAEHYPALDFQIKAYLQKAKDEPYPLIMSLFDLEILTHYLTDPFEFIYYMRQRSQYGEMLSSGNEISYLGFHLRHKLFFEKDKVDKVLLDESFAQFIDADFPVAMGEQPDNSERKDIFNIWKNEKFEKLVDDIKRSSIPTFVDAVLLLFDLRGKGAEELVKQIDNVITLSKNDGKEHSVALLYGSKTYGITYICEPGVSRSKLKKRVLTYSTLKKYQTRTKSWLALGAHSESGNYVDFFAFNDEGWNFDPLMEALVNQSFGKKTGRNDPCTCGSGKKFKKCCLNPVI